jgi:osmoprotectant transport system permease protein
MIWSWIPAHGSAILGYTGDHALLGITPALLGLVISLPLGIVAARWRWFNAPVLGLVNVLYAIPAIALFIAFIPALGLTDTNVIVALTIYSLCVIFPNVVAGLHAVADPVRQSATAMGYGALRRLVLVELPLAAPVIIAGLRVAVVSSISLASISQLIGVYSLGYYFIDGEQRDFFTTEIWVALVLIIALAIACDLVLVGVRRVLTPWMARS